MTTPTDQKQPMSGTTKLLLGCGCLGLGGLVLLGVLVLGGMLAFKKVSKEFDGVSQQMETSSPEDVVAGRGFGLGKKNKDGGMDTFDPRDWHKQPLTPKALGRYLAFRKAWANSDHAKTMAKGTEALKALEKKESTGGVMDGLRAIKAAKDIAVGLGGVEGEGEKIAQEYGGSHVVFADYTRLMALVAAAKAVAEKEGLEPHDDAVAAAMITHQPQAKALRSQWQKGLEDQLEVVRMRGQADWSERAKTEEVKQKMDASSRALTLQAEDAGMLVLAKVPGSSLQTWQGLSAAERQTIFEHHLDPPFSSVLGFVPELAEHVGFRAETFLSWEMADHLEGVDRELNTP